MTRLPPTSAAPDPASIFSQPTSSAAMDQTAAPPPTATPLPVLPLAPLASQRPQSVPPAGTQAQDEEQSNLAISRQLPKLRLNILELTHPGASRFLAAINASDVFATSVKTVLNLLYPSSPSSASNNNSNSAAAITTRSILPGTRSVTLFLEDMSGVAYTKGSDLDDDHKEIHFSLRYISSIKRAPDGAKGDVTGSYEITGVLVHELVHCFQYNGHGTCPGGLIEGIADWVRLKANLGAPHWRRDSLPERWDQGYEKTAYFLEWLEGRFGEGTVRRINATLRTERYEKDKFWQVLLGDEVESLWQEYRKAAGAKN